jgi:membrane-associated protease RseP (regulator of RpoE activity)
MFKGTPILLGLLLLSPAGAAVSASDSAPDEKRIVIRDGEVIRLDGDGEPLVVDRHGRMRRGFIGVRPLEMTPELRVHYGAPRDAGVLIGQVDADGPAGKAGLQVGDVVTAANGERIESASDLSRAVRDKKEGETVKLDVLRDKTRKTITVSVAERKREEIAWNILGPGGHERAVTLPDFEFHWPDRSEMDRLQKRLDELEKKLHEMEKRLQGKTGTNF